MLKTVALMTEVAVDGDTEEVTSKRSKWAGKTMLKTIGLLGELAADVSEEPKKETAEAVAPAKPVAPAKKFGGWGKMKTAALLGELAA